ncbi:MAG TPA: hypothetical protein VHO90_01965 [Bacteroidales bacterium]|nr:hypothetical protein [Bacteroidales bacterium]
MKSHLLQPVLGRLVISKKTSGMKHCQILFLILFNISLSCLAAPYFEVENITKGDFSLPLIKSSKHPEVAERINQIIQMTTVYRSYNIMHDKIFSGMINDDGFTGTTSLSYNVLTNNDAILSIAFGDETLAAYPDYHTYYLNFNSATGDLIDLNELLNKAGIEHLNSKAAETFNSAIKANFETDFRDKKNDSAYLSEMIDITFALTECNATHTLWKFGITPDALIVEKDRCFPHATQAEDIGWSCEIKIDELFSSDFTAYGSRLLKKRMANASWHYDLKEELMTIHGKIDNKFPFNMYLRLYSDNSIGGDYWYTKFGNIINLKGTRISNDKIVLTEDSGARFDFSITPDGNIQGSWIASDGKVHPITID